MGCRVPPHRLRSHVRLAGRVLIAFAGFLFPSYHGSILQLPRCPAARSPWFIPPPLPFQPPICFLCFCILSWKKNRFLLNFSAWVGFHRPPACLPRAASFLIPHGGTTPPSHSPSIIQKPTPAVRDNCYFYIWVRKIIKHQEDQWCGQSVLPRPRSIQHRLPFAPANASSHVSGCWGGIF